MNEWLAESPHEADTLVEKSLANQCETPSETAINSAREVSERLARSMKLSPDIILPNDDQIVTIQMGNKSYGGTVVIIFDADGSALVYMAGQGIRFERPFPSSSVIPGLSLRKMMAWSSK